MFICLEYSEIVTGVKTGQNSGIFALRLTGRWLALTVTALSLCCRDFSQNFIANGIMAVLITCNLIYFSQGLEIFD